MKLAAANLTSDDICDILEDSGYMGFTIDTAVFAGTCDGDVLAVYTCTAPDESGIEETLTFNVFITAMPDGTLQADF